MGRARDMCSLHLTVVCAFPFPQVLRDPETGTGEAGTNLVSEHRVLRVDPVLGTVDNHTVWAPAGQADHHYD